jgi:hypothetical protein
VSGRTPTVVGPVGFTAQREPDYDGVVQIVRGGTFVPLDG